MHEVGHPSFLFLFGRRTDCPGHSPLHSLSSDPVFSSSMGQSSAGSRWTGSSPASLRSSTNLFCTFIASPTWRWWLATPTSTETCCRSTTTTTSARRCRRLTRCSGSSYRDRVGFFFFPKWLFLIYSRNQACWVLNCSVRRIFPSTIEILRIVS